MGLKEIFGSSWIEIERFFKRPRQAIHHLLNFGCILFCAMMLWKALMICTGSQSPVVVVLSGSMEPGFYRGDILFLYNPVQLETGEVVVFQVDGRDIPIVHRIISYYGSGKEIQILTKGDNNNIDDRGLYAKNQKWLKKENILGTAVGYLPYVGMITIWLNEYPLLKYIVIGCMILLVIFGRD